jgi:hypothetical protein
MQWKNPFDVYFVSPMKFMLFVLLRQGQSVSAHIDYRIISILSQITAVHTTSSCLSKIHFNIIYPPSSLSSLWSLSWLAHECPICTRVLPHTCYMPYPPHWPWLDNSNYTWWRVHVMKLLIMQFCPPSCHVISPWSKCPPQHPVLEHPQSMVLP